jgi:hypothetical protein
VEDLRHVNGMKVKKMFLRGFVRFVLAEEVGIEKKWANFRPLGGGNEN